MATLNLKTFTQLVQDQAAAIQSKCAKLVDFTTGSILRAVTEANAAIALWLQADFLQVLATTRLATSTGGDADTFINDFGLTRLAAAPSAGLVVFSRFTATAQALIPLGTVVSTGDGTQKFTVIADPSNTAFDAGQGAYVMAPGLATLSVLVKANTPAAASNVQAGTISLISSNLPGVDTVNNAGAFTGGSDAETDDELRARFRLFIASLSKATTLAVRFAVESLQLGLECTITENETYDGAARPGSFFVVVDDGSGSPSAAIVDQVATAVELVRPLGVTYAVFPPQIVNASISISLNVAPGYDRNVVVGVVDNAVQTYVNTLPLGQGLAYLKLAQVALNASPGVAGIASLVLNGAQNQDIAISPKQVIKISTLTVV